MDRAVIFRSDPGLVTNILSSHIHGGVSRHLPDPDVDLVSEDAKTLPCHASVLAAASPLLARLLGLGSHPHAALGKRAHMAAQRHPHEEGVRRR
mgnify:CR=1 FL=1